MDKEEFIRRLEGLLDDIESSARNEHGGMVMQRVDDVRELLVKWIQSSDDET